MIAIFVSGIVIGKYLIFQNTIYSGPNSNEIRKNVYKISENEYIQYDIEMCICPPSAKNLFKEKMKKEI